MIEALICFYRSNLILSSLDSHKYPSKQRIYIIKFYFNIIYDFQADS